VKRQSDRPRPVPSETYSTDYFLGECEGYSDFAKGRVSPRLERALGYVDAGPGRRILDLGCGRGEATAWAARKGALVCGADYAAHALRIAQERCSTTDGEGLILLVRADACALPFADGAFERVMMLDIVEHLYPWQLERTFTEVYRVLSTGGLLVVHTAPNLWYYRFGYPLFRIVQALRGIRLPRNPRARYRYHERVHVNEQSPTSLWRGLRRVHFGVRVWVDDSRLDTSALGGFLQRVVRLGLRIAPIRWVLASDVFAIAIKS